MNIKQYIKQRGYTYQKVAHELGYSLPTLEKLIVTRPNAIYYAVKGLPEISHIKRERIKQIRNK